MGWVLASRRLPEDKASVWIRFDGNIELAYYDMKHRRFYSEGVWMDDEAPQLMWSNDAFVLVRSIKLWPLFQN
jgi:hypothetical protein